MARDIDNSFSGAVPDTTLNELSEQVQSSALEVIGPTATTDKHARSTANVEPRYKLLDGDGLAALPALEWRVRGVLPASGLAAIYGRSGTGKSFLAFDMAAAIAEGRDWFGYRVMATQVVYVALEGEAGFKLRAQAWEAQNSRKLPAALKLILQPFKLSAEQDVNDLADIVPPGAVILIDTLNRAAPSADENSSRDMGMILEAAKHLQAVCKGLVVLIHHSGKDGTKGLRGHSSLVAALDAAIEVTRTGSQRKWGLEKSKDGADGAGHSFTLATRVVDSDEYGDDLTSCVVLPDVGTQLVQSAKVPQGANQGLVMDVVRKLLANAAQSGSQSAPATLPAGKAAIELEASLPLISSQLNCPTDKRTSRARTALKALVSKGLLACVDGWIWIP